MKLFKNVFARIWAVWALISFLASFFIIFIPSMITWLIPDPKGQVYFIRLARYWMNVWLALVGCPVSISGKERFVPGKTYVVVFNHNTLLDATISCPFVPGANKTIAKISFSRVPIFGWYYSKGSVLIDRSNEKSRKKSFEDMKEVLTHGMHMCIYPEGTRNRTAEPLKEFYDGAFKLAVDTGKEIIPAIILGTKKAMPVHKTFYLLPTRLKMHFLPPIPSTNTTAKELKEKVFNEMKRYYVENS